MIRFLFALVIVAFASTASAQQTQTLEWDFATSLTEVNTYGQAVTIDGAARTGTIACRSVSATLTTCALPLSPVLASGTHVISVAATRNGSTAETRFTGLDPSTGPRNATGARIVVTVSITVP